MATASAYPADPVTNRRGTGTGTTNVSSRWDEEKRPLFFRLRGTIILKIWWQVLIMLFYTVAVVCLNNYVTTDIGFPLSLVPVLGVVTGLLLVFRTNTAYDRYWDGRRIWSEMTYNIRHLTCTIWAGVDQPVIPKVKNRKHHHDDNSDDSQDDDDNENEDDQKVDHEAAARILVEKISVINLLVAFAYATKNYLRQEYSYEASDIKDLICHLPRFQSTDPDHSKDRPSPLRRTNHYGNHRHKQKRNRKTVAYRASQDNGGYEVDHDDGGGGGDGGTSPPSTTSINSDSHSTSIFFHNGDYLTKNNEASPLPPIIVSGPPQAPPAPHSPSAARIMKRRSTLGAQSQTVATNIPIEISIFLFSYIRRVGALGLVDPSLMKVMYEANMSLVECLTGFERIIGTPIPLAYGVHLHQAVWLYLLALPYQLVGSLSWWTCPAVALVSFALLGILGIGREIENPFGYDANDLPLDDFCKVIRREVQVIIGRVVPSLETWIISPDNYPLAPNSWLGANELLKKSEAQVTEILAAQGAQFPIAPSTNSKKNRV